MVLLAATPARQGGPLGGFDPASTLGWSVPLILIAPLVALAMMISGVRTRRGAATLAELGVLASGLGVGFAIWARWKQPGAYTASYQWINIPVAFTGPTQFQAFGIDQSIRLDHLALAYLVTLLLLALLAIVWHRVAGRGEPGPVRFYALCLLLVVGGAGTLVAPDLAELAAFWGFTAVATYLLLAQRWGVEPASRGARVALWLPFAADLCLLAGIGVLYSRYGQLTLDKLVPVLHTTPGWGYRSLTVAGGLIAVAVAGRLGLFPLSAWTTSSTEAPPASHALALGTWTLLPLYVLWRLQPIILSSGAHAGARLAAVIAIVGLAGPLLALVGNDLRRSLVLASSGVAALAMLAMVSWPATFSSPAVAALTVAAVPALALGRAAALLAAGTVVVAMRTADLALMGDAARRLPLTSAGMLLGCLASMLALAAPASFFGTAPGPTLGGRMPWIFGVGLLVSAISLARPYFAIAFGPLRRRRAFEPDRVREIAGTAAWSVLLLALLGLAAVVLDFLTAWIGFLFGKAQAPDVLRTSVLGGSTLAAVLLIAAPAGLALGAVVYGFAKARPLLGSAWLGRRWQDGVAICWRLFDRFLAGPVLGIVSLVEGTALGSGEARLGLSLVGIGRDVRRLGFGLPLLPVLLLLAVAIALLVGLATPGLAR
jgi:NADH:ubiquinone oxidoreductase subunit 5 (subunit L)/multisubunit Na+/H+ antiporter MnhA subunit